jgi:hypothetical protein
VISWGVAPSYASLVPCGIRRHPGERRKLQEGVDHGHGNVSMREVREGEYEEADESEECEYEGGDKAEGR